jgi:ribosomal protein S18 acetylase RimI-like enzyme
MPSYRFVKHPGADHIEQILQLYRLAGWWTGSPNDRQAAADIIAGSHCFRVALSDNRIIAMGRAISDGVSDAYIQDVMVRPEFRNQGIASRIVRDLVDQLESDGIGWIGLIAERGSQGFYRRFGFAPMPDATPMLRLKTEP